MSELTRSRFLHALDEIEANMSSLGFVRCSPVCQGYATWVSFIKPGLEVEFVCSPPGYHIEIFIEIKSKSEGLRYDFADLMQIKQVKDWVRANKLSPNDQYPLVSEAFWFVDLLSIALTTLQCD